MMIFQTLQITNETIAYIVVSIDLLILFIFIGSIWCMKYAQQDTVNRFDKYFNLSQFAIEVKIKKNKNISSQLFLHELCKVIEQNLRKQINQQELILYASTLNVKNNKVHYIHFKKVMDIAYDSYIKKKKSISKINFDKVWKKLNEHNKIIMNNQDNQEEYVWIIFYQKKIRDLALNLFTYSWVDQKLCFKNLESKKVDGKLVKAKYPPAPDLIIWQNLSNSFCYKFVRILIICLITIVFFIGVYFLIAYVQYQNNLIKQNYNIIVDCDMIQVKFNSESIFDQKYNDKQKYPGYKHCYCMAKVSLNNIFSNLQPNCVEWLQDVVLGLIIPILISLAISFLELILSFIYQILSRFEGHSSLYDLKFSNFIKQVISMFLISGLIIMVVNIYYSIDPVERMSIILFGGQYDGFNPSWYYTVGYIILFTMIINILVPITQFIIIRLYVFLRKLCDKGCTFKKFYSGLNSINKYVQLYSGPQFQIHYKYAMILKIIMITFFYSAIIPFLYIVAFVSMMIIFLFDKVMIAKLYKKPPNYDHNLHKRIRNYLIIPIIIHCISNLFFLAEPAIFPLKDENYLQDQLKKIGLKQDFVNYPHTYPYLALIIFIVLYIVWKGFIQKCLKNFFCCANKKFFVTDKYITITRNQQIYLLDIMNANMKNIMRKDVQYNLLNCRNKELDGIKKNKLFYNNNSRQFTVIKNKKPSTIQQMQNRYVYNLLKASMNLKKFIQPSKKHFLIGNPIYKQELKANQLQIKNKLSDYKILLQNI